jgi:fluoroquinolone transport system permease protein
MVRVLRLWARQIGLLTPATVRAGQWLPILPAGALALLAIALAARTPDAGFVAPRLAAVALALGSAFVLDDPATELLACSPTPLWVRRLVRVGVLLPLLGLLWAAVLGRGGLAVLPVGALTLELAAMVTVTLALSAWAALRSGDGLGGRAGGPGLLALLPLAWQAHLWAGIPGDPQWAVAHRRWLATLVAAAALLLWASLDPGRSPVRVHPQRRDDPAE